MRVKKPNVGRDLAGLLAPIYTLKEVKRVKSYWYYKVCTLQGSLQGFTL
jgi:hypothetical protein